MAQSSARVEVFFIQVADNENGFEPLGNFAIDGSSYSHPMLHVPDIGDRVVLDLPLKDFAGFVTRKAVIYSQRDVSGKHWDLVTRIVLTIERDVSLEDVPMKTLAIQ